MAAEIVPLLLIPPPKVEMVTDPPERALPATKMPPPEIVPILAMPPAKVETVTDTPEARPPTNMPGAAPPVAAIVPLLLMPPRKVGPVIAMPVWVLEIALLASRLMPPAIDARRADEARDAAVGEGDAARRDRAFVGDVAAEARIGNGDAGCRVRKRIVECRPDGVAACGHMRRTRRRRPGAPPPSSTAEDRPCAAAYPSTQNPNPGPAVGPGPNRVRAPQAPLWHVAKTAGTSRKVIFYQCCHRVTEVRSSRPSWTLPKSRQRPAFTRAAARHARAPAAAPGGCPRRSACAHPDHRPQGRRE